MLAMLLLLIDSEEDQRKFEELYHRYKQLMFHVSRDYFHTESAVEDAVQEAFIRIIKNFSKNRRNKLSPNETFYRYSS